jgi:F0F1-type ATP synthase membrane subunit b/b'
MAQLERDIIDVKARGLAEGEEARAGLVRRAEEEGERIRREAEEEIARRLALAREQLKRSAADLTAAAALERLSAEITDADRSRLLGEAIGNLAERR